MIKYEVKNRDTGEVQFIAEIGCEETERESVKKGLAVVWAVANDADFTGANLTNAYLTDADLRGADLSRVYLIGANLRNANLTGANLTDADLICADLSGAPKCLKIKDIHKKIYEATKEKDALDMDEWHTCETTHCRAGWVVHLAGDAGKVLEWQLTTPTAAAIIYQLSDPRLEKIPDFYCGNHEAMKDIKELAQRKNKR